MSHMKVFPATHKAIAEEIDRLVLHLRAFQEEKRRSAHNLDGGDMMDDPLLHQQMEQIGMLQAKITTYQRHLSRETDFIDARSLGASSIVQLGHRVKVRVEDESGEKEEYYVTLGSSLDRQFLGDNRTYFDNLDEVMVSEDSLLGQQLVGARENQTVMYRSPNGLNIVKVLSICVSPLLE